MANTLVLDKTKVLKPYEVVVCQQEAPQEPDNHGPDMVFTRDDLLKYTPKQIIAMMRGEIEKPR